MAIKYCIITAFDADGRLLDLMSTTDFDYEAYLKLINQALREWLSAEEVKELIREELPKMVQQAIFAIQAATPLPKAETF